MALHVACRRRDRHGIREGDMVLAFLSLPQVEDATRDTGAGARLFNVAAIAQGL